MKTTFRLITLCAVAAASSLAIAAEGDLSKMDQKFIMTASGAGMYEVEISKLAVDKASDPAVKAFAQMMVTDHTKANDELKQFADSHNAKVAPGVPKDKQAVIARMSKMDGARFDKAYHDQVGIKDHKTDIALFEKEAKGGGNADLKAWADKTLPTLKTHLQHAQDMKPKS
ncbi:DUF4142 domain-containing protein [Xylophilus sp. Kf1]|nr:DUF4142 domain-containing protein [Xylophilus sp. Kf1]